jgi:tetratricopeptide (TPR) repeat protein
MKVYCNYHPTKPALWMCPTCNVYYCDGCIAKNVSQAYGATQAYHVCPKCNARAKQLALGNVIEPFWKILPKIFLYPFHLRSLILIVVLTLVSSFFWGGGFFRLLMRGIIWGMLVKYSYAALKETASGRLIPPEITSETLTSDSFIVFKQFGLYFAVFFAFGMIAKVGGILMGLLFLGFALLLLPAMITVLVVTESLISACNPWVFARMAWRIGWGYLLMYLFLIFLIGAPIALAQYIIVLLPKGLHIFLFLLAGNIYTLISYHLMGYVLLQYHEEVGWEVYLEDYVPSEKKSSEEEMASNPLRKVDILIQDGQLDEAITFIKNETQGAITDINLAERYYKLLKLKQLTPELLEHCKVYLDILVQENQVEKVCQVYSECVAKDPNFIPTPANLFKIATMLDKGRNHRGAVTALNRFIKANPKSPLVPKAYFLAANIMHEKLNASQKAAEVLTILIKKYPAHDIVSHAEDYLKRISGH